MGLHFLAASLVVVSVCAPMCAHAQSVPVPYEWAYAYGPNSAGEMGTPQGIYCGTFSPQLGAGTYSTACTSAAGLPGASYTAFGRAEVGQTGGRAVLDATDLGFADGSPGYGFQERWGTIAYSRWADRVSFTGVQPSTIELTLSWDGRLAGHLTFLNPDIYNAGQGGNGFASWGFTATSPDGQLASYQNDANITVVRYQTQDAKDVADVRTFVVPVGAAGYIDFMHELTIGAQIGGSFYGDIRVSGELSIDFANTGKLIGFVARDASGTDITAQTGYAFTNGTQISPVPEPNTWAMLGTGLLAMGGLVSRRRIG